MSRDELVRIETKSVWGETLTGEYLFPKLMEKVDEWENEDDWWYSFEESFREAPLGIDVNVFDETYDTDIPFGFHKAVVYGLTKGEDHIKEAKCRDVLLSFYIPNGRKED